MTAIISTYRHDYTAPKNARYSFLKKVQINADPCKEICPCVEEKPRVDLSKLGEKCETTNWTGTAPAEKMDVPHMAAEPPLMAKEASTDPCFHDQPNRFLKTISNTYPDLYERLKNMPHDELRRSIENSRFRTTYQVDYCHLDEHAPRFYEDSKERKDEAQYRMAKLNDPCEMFDTNDYQVKGRFGGGDGLFGGGKDEAPLEEIKMYKPVKEAPKQEEGRKSTSHWDAGKFTKQLNLSEYMDTMCRTGLIVLESNLHDHSACRKGKNCNHVIKSKDPKGLKLLINKFQ